MSQGNQTSFLDDALNILVQSTSGGIIGFGEDGFRKGVATDAALDATKELTGAAAAEEANNLAREQFEADKERLDQQRTNQLSENERRQVQLSRGAPGARTQGSSTGGNTSTSVSNLEQDFLGL